MILEFMYITCFKFKSWKSWDGNLESERMYFSVKNKTLTKDLKWFLKVTNIYIWVLVKLSSHE